MVRRFRAVVADPPWPFLDSNPGPGRGAAKHYALMSLTDIMLFRLPKIADDALLFLWRVSCMQPEAIAVCRAWGFEPYGEMVWRKLTTRGNPVMGMGRVTRNGHESVLIGRRGKPRIKNHDVRSIFEAKTGKHSEKPDTFYELVERLSAGPYLELFARRERDGWTTLGDEVSYGSRA